MVRVVAALVAVLGLGGASGCRRAPPAPGLPAATALEGVQFSGCAAVRAGPVCVLDAGRVVRVWLPSSQRLVSAVADRGAIAPSAGRDVEGGVLRAFAVPEGASELRITVAVAVEDGGAAKSWALRVTAAEAPGTAVIEARALREKGDGAGAAKRLREALDAAGPAAAEGAPLLDELGRVEMGRGEYAAAREVLADALARNEERGAVSDAANEAFAMTFAAMAEHRFAEARGALARGARWAAVFPDAAVMASYYDGRLASEAGDKRTALAAFHRTEALAARLGSERSRLQAQQTVADELMELGRTADAVAILSAQDESDGAHALSVCDRALLRDDLGWAMVLENAASGEARHDPRALLEDAATTLGDTCGDPHRASNALVNLALAEVARGDVRAAGAALARAEARVRDPEATLRAAWLETEGRVALARRDGAAAYAAFDRLAVLASAAGVLGLRFRALDGRAEALAAQGKRSEAMAAYAALDRLVTSALRAVPLGEGRGSFLAAHGASTRRRVELALTAGDVRGALAVARSAEAQLVADVQRVDRIAHLEGDARARWEAAMGAYQRDREALAEAAAGDWALSKTELARAVAERAAKGAELRAAIEAVAAGLPIGGGAAAPIASGIAAGTVLVVYAPLPAGFVALVASGGERSGVRAVRLPAVDPRAAPDALASQIVAPIAPLLAGAKRLRIVAQGALAPVDVHALTYEGAPLIALAPVEYPLDLGPLVAAPDPRAALIVADPAGDLPRAREEGGTIAGVLSSRGLATRALVGKAATRRAVEDGLAGASLFHFAGHGAFAGEDGWRSGLSLAPPDVLEVGDVLALPHAPAAVILSGCETAGRGPRAAGLSVASAFLAAGSAEVVAASRDVDDETTDELMTELHRALARAPGDGLAPALRAAQLAVAARHPAHDWAAFRAIVR